MFGKASRATQAVPAAERTVASTLEFLDHLLAPIPLRNFRVRLWEGTTWGEGGDPRFTLALQHPGALPSMFQSPSELALGEAYIFNDYDIEGDIGACFELATLLLSQKRSTGEKLRLATLLSRLPATRRPRAVPRQARLHGKVHSRGRDREAIHYHYDLPPEFYALFLDQRLVYSDAYFRSPEDTLDQAQEQKLEYICRKLQLRPGERLLDIGCGWGALILYAAKQYGVTAQGITLSTEQAEYTRQRIGEAGLEDRCRVELRDYRDVEMDGQFDKIVSVGMFEHVGEDLLPEYFERADRLLRPKGIFLNTGIAYSATYRRAGPSFTECYVFPDGELVPINVTLRAAEESGFEVRDVENLREHYAMTLEHWVKRLESGADEARRIADDTTYRIWRLYMAGSAAAFYSGRLNLYHTLLVKSDHGRTDLPLTRDGWYQ